MAHIVSCMADVDLDSGKLNSYIAKPTSPQPSMDSFLQLTSPTTEAPLDRHPFAWRMHQPEGRKYQLFPKSGQLAGGKGLDPEQAFALAMGQAQKGDKTDKQPSSGLRLRIKEHNLNRRRKVSVPELGPMTTVQEVAMDSPTIPGRPPLHERSISAPGNSWRLHQQTESTTSLVAEETSEHRMSPVPELQRSASATPRQPLSPKQLAPLVIPTQQGSVPRLTRQISLTRLRSGSIPTEPQLRSARADDSPRARTPFTPLSASTALTTPQSATSALTASTLPTPVSAPIIGSRSSPKPWEGRTATTPNQTTIELAPTPKTDEPRSANAVMYGHRRGQSESGSIMERGRPRKRMEVRNNSISTLNGTETKRSKSAERRAFEDLPKGWKVCDAVHALSPTDVAALHQQAIGQASRFEVLKKEDVDSLSKELRQLDERTEYLRRTYTSLRAGRRNLHSRICQYLRSPRVAKFSHDSMLKQEEALAELDASIDDWVTKLEQAENRRTRVRQKLLEHVAAAATLPTAGAAAASESLQLAMGIRSPAHVGAGNISTPPRSPTKVVFAPHTTSSSPSPQRVVAQVPSTILEQPLFEEAATMDDEASVLAGLRRADVESIRIYADSDVYALLADVENQITKMSGGVTETPPPMTEVDRKKLHRARSHELLSGMVKGITSPVPPSPPAPSPPMKNSPVVDNEAIFLTNAVFRPNMPERALTAA